MAGGEDSHAGAGLGGTVGAGEALDAGADLDGADLTTATNWSRDGSSGNTNTYALAAVDICALYGADRFATHPVMDARPTDSFLASVLQNTTRSVVTSSCPGFFLCCTPVSDSSTPDDAMERTPRLHRPDHDAGRGHTVNSALPAPRPLLEPGPRHDEHIVHRSAKRLRTLAYGRTGTCVRVVDGQSERP